MTEPTLQRRRRKVLAAAVAAWALPNLAWAKTLLPTPAQTAGPFYPDTLPLDDDNDLTQVAGSSTSAMGQHTDLYGRIVDTNGHPLSGIRIEIWQCDANGRYHHPRDNRQAALDRNFQGHGHALTDAQGSYRFRTILPVHYPGRAPHIHAAVFTAGRKALVTQIYIKDEPRNPQDFLFKRIPVEKRPLVAAEFRPVTGGATTYAARFDLVVGITPQQA